jgi:transposase
VRTRQAAKGDQRRARQRVNQFLLRQGRRYPYGTRRWGEKHLHWLRGVRFASFALQSTMVDLLGEVDHATARLERLERAIDQAVTEAPESMQQVIAALQALRGIAKTTAVGIVAELGQISRFDHPSQLMSYVGLVSSEWSSGAKKVQGSITKAGNTHLRKLLVESSWSYRHRPALRAELKRRQEGLDDEVRAIGWKAQHRLHLRYRRLVGHGKRSPVAVTAVARELLGFVWAIGVHVEQPRAPRRKAA